MQVAVVAFSAPERQPLSAYRLEEEEGSRRCHLAVPREVCSVCVLL